MGDNLNQEQIEAVQTTSGPLLVLAGAGSGKTRVVTFRIANLVKHRVAADRILAVTFTNKAAQEMRQRVLDRLGLKRKSKNAQQPSPVVGTFHSNCVQILRRHCKRLGYPGKFAIYDRSDQESVARDVLRQLRVDSGMLKPGDFLAYISRWKNLGVRPDGASDLARSDSEHVAASGYRRYQQALKLGGAMDFDDLLLLTVDLFEQFPDVLADEQNRFEHILVDEYQDTNQSQYQIIKHLAAIHRNLCVVGDDDQSIYGWRGAEVKHILNFKRDWPEAKVIRLEANYRSTAAILAVANCLIAFNNTRHQKILRAARIGGTEPRVLQFKNEVEEAKGIAQEIQKILNRRERQPGDFAILFRTNEQPRVFETELRKAKIPYVLLGSQSFFDRKEVRDLLSYLKVIDNPRDEVALLRIINLPPRGIGTSTTAQLLDSAVSQGKSVWEVMENDTASKPTPGPAKRGIQTLQSVIAKFSQRAHAGDSLASLVRDLVSEIRFLDDLVRQYPDPEQRSGREASIEEVINAVAEYEADAAKPSLADFLADTMLAGKEFGSPKEKALQSNAVSLMTYHSAKGLEFPIVYMVGMEEGVIPHSRSIIDNPDDVEEERRLCYVGVTRAEDELTLSLPLERMKWGKPRPTFPSRFLYEMTGQAENPNRLKAIVNARREIRRGTKTITK